MALFFGRAELALWNCRFSSGHDFSRAAKRATLENAVIPNEVRDLRFLLEVNHRKQRILFRAGRLPSPGPDDHSRLIF